jgi:hypothetical protein
VCTCTTRTDCPPGQACQSDGTCGSNCSGGLLCNGCCDGMNCHTGVTDFHCGLSGGACANCNSTCNPGSVCRMWMGNAKCGCGDNGDCPGSLCGANTVCDAGAFSGAGACGP